MAFNVSGELLSSKYLKESDLIDDYIGNRLWLWGYGGDGELGDNTRNNASSPVQTYSGGTNWKQVSVSGIASSGITTSGNLFTWGINAYGQLGDNTRTYQSQPTQTIAGGTNWKQMSFGYSHAAAIKTNGSLWLWGKNQYGALGDNTTNDRSSPVQTIAGGTNWKQASASRHTSASKNYTAAIKTDGTLWLWGDNQYGQIGNNNTGLYPVSPVQTISGGTNWKQVACGYASTAAIKTDGTLWLWGRNNYGQLGNNDTTDRSSPVQTVASGTNWKYVSVSTHTAAIKTDGTLWLWGNNNYGQLGDNSQTNTSSPIQTIAGGTNWKTMDPGGYAFGWTAAIKTDGTLWLWGVNSNGNLGTNNRTHYSSPVQTISGGTNWKLVSCGVYNTAAITFSDYQ